MKKRALILTTLSILLATSIQAQNPQRAAHGDVGLYLLSDSYKASSPIFGGVIYFDWMRPLVDIHGGMEKATGKISLDLEFKVQLHDFQNGFLFAQNRYLYRQFTDLELQEFTSALEMGYYGGHLGFDIGLCNRYLASLVQRENGGMNTIFEPMNVLFGVEAWLWNRRESTRLWNIGVKWSNYNDFVIERVANWSYSLKGFLIMPKLPNLKATLEAGTHPVGALNLTSSPNGFFIHLGANWKVY